jgi:hypothetical protein
MSWGSFALRRLVPPKLIQSHKRRLASTTGRPREVHEVVAEVTTTVQSVTQKGTGSNARTVVKAEGRDENGSKVKGKVDLRGIHAIRGAPRVVEIGSRVRVVHARRHAKKKLKGGTWTLIP